MGSHTEIAFPQRDTMDKPLIGIDMDGVICRPPLGLNIPIAPGPYSESSSPPGQRQAPRGLSLLALKLLLKLKYFARPPLPDALVGIKAISEHRTPVLVTSRNGAGSELIDAWLRKYELASFFKEIHPNNLGLSSPDFKWLMCFRLGIREFVDDDGRVADHLSRKGLDTVFLRDWPKNRGYDYLPNVTRVQSLSEVADTLALK